MEYEILFVDDGSRDGTFRKATELAGGTARLRVIKFRRNYGQTPAMAAGIDHARGKILITMDGDLQNDPADIPKFLEKITEGNDIVCGWRHKRQDKLISRKIPSVIANRLIGRITGVPIKDNGCSLKAYRADIIKSIPLYSDMHRFIPAMTSMAGTKVAEIKVNHRPAAVRRIEVRDLEDLQGDHRPPRHQDDAFFRDEAAAAVRRGRDAVAHRGGGSSWPWG